MSQNLIADDVARIANASAVAINGFALQVQTQMSKVRQATIMNAANIDQVHNATIQNTQHLVFWAKFNYLFPHISSSLGQWIFT